MVGEKRICGGREPYESEQQSSSYASSAGDGLESPHKATECHSVLQTSDPGLKVYHFGACWSSARVVEGARTRTAKDGKRDLRKDPIILGLEA